MVAPVLVFGYGNPSRGDDALGPALLERIDALRARHPEWPPVELLTDFQLQVEHALDLARRNVVLFVDADLNVPAPFRYARVAPVATSAYTSHALSPAELLGVYGRVVDGPPPAAFVLGIRGQRFGLGEPLSPPAQANLAEAVAFTAALLAQPDPAHWEATAHA